MGDKYQFKVIFHNKNSSIINWYGFYISKFIINKYYVNTATPINLLFTFKNKIISIFY